jgi:hypothetical protein
VTTVPKAHQPRQTCTQSTAPASRRTAKGARIALLATLALSGLATGTASAAECPNEQLRAENNSTQLPNCRAYEQVTPTYKQGIRAEGPSLRNDGNAMSFKSTGNFAGSNQGLSFNSYLSQRGAQGWSTEPTAPGDDEYESEAGLVTSSADQAEQVLELRRVTQSSIGRGYYLRRSNGAIAEIGPITSPASEITPPGESEGQNQPEFIAASADLSHIVYLPFSSTLDEYVGTGNSAPSVVNRDNFGTTLECVVSGGNRLGAPAMSRDGSRIFFGCLEAGAFTRVDATSTIALSSSQCTRTVGDPGGACNEAASAGLVGIAADGSIAYFTTSQQLVNADIDEGQDLYACRLPAGSIAPQGNINPCPSLEPVSVTGTGGGANVVEVLDISEDGSRVAFVATGVLSGANTNADGESAVEGANNLYVFEQGATEGSTRFVADLCSGAGMSGSAVDVRCPPSPGAADGIPELQMAPADGRFMVFTTSARLGAGDTDEAQDIYRYDAETGSLARASSGHAGYSNNGNAPATNANINGRTVLSENGSRVFFTTVEALTPQDTNGQGDVYEWENGQVNLISDGVDPGGSNLVQASASGDDVVFETQAHLTWQDGDTVQDIYDARVDGGFAAPGASTTCVGEGCQGPSGPMIALALPGSATASGLGDLVSGLLPVSTRKLSVLSARTIVGSSGALKIRVPGKGGLVVSGLGLKPAQATVFGAGVVSVRILLTRKARASLSAKRTLKTKVRAVFKSSGGATSSVVVQLSFKESLQTHNQSGVKTGKGHS